MKCPVCNKRSKFWNEFKSNKIDQSGLYQNIIIYHCNNCNHYFNKIDKKDKKYLINYTNELAGKRITIGDNNILCLDHIIEHFFLDSFTKILFEQYDIIDIKCPIVSEYLSMQDKDQKYCWLIKEHVHHFSKESILKLFKNFYLQHFSLYNFKELNNKLFIPSMHLILTKFDPNGYYYYGAGREFLYTYAERINWNKKELFNKIRILDDKEYGNTINGIPIFHSNIVPYLSSDAKINVTSWYHQDEMRHKLIEKGFKGIIE